MSYCAVVFRINFGRLESLWGSRAATTLARISVRLRESEDCAEGDDELEEGEERSPTPVEALRHIIMGEPLAEDYPEAYGTALIALCWDMGYVLENASVAPAELSHIDAVDSVLASHGYREPVRLYNLISRGIPVFGLDSPEPFPTIGYLTPDEVAATPSLHRRWESGGPEVLQTLGEMANWFRTASEAGQGLIGFYG